MGWEDELDMMDLEDYGPLVDHPGVHVAQELTDNGKSYEQYYCSYSHPIT